MRLYKKAGSPYWWMDIKVGNQRIRRSTKRLHCDRKGAQRVMASEYEARMNVSQFRDKAEITLEEAFDRTLGEVRGQTYRVYRASYHALQSVLGSGKLLSTITSEDLNHFVRVRFEQGLKANSVRSDLKALKRTINRVRTTDRTNPDLLWPKLEAFKKTRYLSEVEEKELLGKLLEDSGLNVTALKAYRLCVFLLDTGMRLREATGIKWAHIDTTRRVIEVYRPKTRSVSVVPISDRVLVILKQVESQDEPFEKVEWAITYLRRAIGSVGNRDGHIAETRGKATIHSLRDTYASRMLKRGMSIYKLAKLLGHSSTAMSEKYGHLEIQDLVEEARRLMAG